MKPSGKIIFIILNITVFAILFTLIIPFAADSTYESTLIAYYNFDGTDISADSGGSGLNGTVTGDIKSTEGISGNAAAFNGFSGIRVTTAYTQETRPRQFTLTFWAYLNSFSDSYNSVFHSYDWNKTGKLRVELHSTGQVYADICKTDNANVCTAEGTVKTKEWAFYAVTIDVEAGIIRTYINGILANSSDFTPASSYGIDISDFTIGGWMNSYTTDIDGTRGFIGNIDEVRLYGSELTAGEIKEVMDSVNTVPEDTGTVFTGSDETEPVATAPAETKPAGTKPVEIKPAETLPIKTNPAETKPHEPVKTGAVDTDTGDTKSAASEPAGTEPADSETDNTGPVPETDDTVYISDTDMDSDIYVLNMSSPDTGVPIYIIIGAFAVLFGTVSFMIIKNFLRKKE